MMAPDYAETKMPDGGWTANGLSAWFALIILILAIVFTTENPALHSYSFVKHHDDIAVNLPAHQEHKGLNSNYTAHKALSQLQREIRASRIDDDDKDTYPPSEIIALPSHPLVKIQKLAGRALVSSHAIPFLFERTAQPRAPPFLA